MVQVEINFQIKIPNEKCINDSQHLELTTEQWNHIISLHKACQTRKMTAVDLIIDHLLDYLENLTPEKAEDIVTSWDF